MARQVGGGCQRRQDLWLKEEEMSERGGLHESNTLTFEPNLVVRIAGSCIGVRLLIDFIIL